MASNANMQESKEAASLFSMNVDMERMSDHAVNIGEAGEDLVRYDLSFSLEAYDEIQKLSEILIDSFDTVKLIIDTKDRGLFEKIQRNEEEIDELCVKYREVEIERMRNSADEAKSGITYSELLIDIERIGDHIMNIAESLCERESIEG
jgi:phosphate:Na+ symporter